MSDLGDLTKQILYELENSGRTLPEFLCDLNDQDGAAFDFLNTLIDAVILPYERGE